MATGVLTEDLLGGTTVDERTDIEGLPADVERTEVVCSTKFRPNAGDGDLLGRVTEIAGRAFVPLLKPLPDREEGA